MWFKKKQPKQKLTLQDIEPFTIVRDGNNNYVVQLNGQDCFVNENHEFAPDIFHGWLASRRNLDHAIYLAYRLKKDKIRQDNELAYRQRAQIRIPL